MWKPCPEVAGPLSAASTTPLGPNFVLYCEGLLGGQVLQEDFVEKLKPWAFLWALDKTLGLYPRGGSQCAQGNLP